MKPNRKTYEESASRAKKQPRRAQEARPAYFEALTITDLALAAAAGYLVHVLQTL